jgi:hypothetical protein
VIRGKRKEMRGKEETRKKDDWTNGRLDEQEMLGCITRDQ